MGSTLGTERLFASRSCLEESGRDLRRKKLGSEMDLNYYIRFAEETPVMRIVEALSHHRRLRKTFGMHLSAEFEKHTNTLSIGRVEDDMRGLSRGSRRRSPRLHGMSHNSYPPRYHLHALKLTRSAYTTLAMGFEFCRV